MVDMTWVEQAAEKTISRLLPRLNLLFDRDSEWDEFSTRLRQHLPQALFHLLNLYGDQYDFYYHLERIIETTARMYMERSSALKTLDRERVADPNWYLQQTAVGAVCYVKRFADDLAGLRKKIPYLQELGITYLHLMPLFRTPTGKSDDGYAISDFRQVNPALGTMNDLSDLATALREAGISLVLDFVFNHTSDEHPWAKQALAGDATYQDYYYMFPDRTLPDRYEVHLREIFPEQAPGNFTYRPEIDRWVWTTFNTFQWDLNYSNPQVFDAMLAEMLFIANQGAAVLRLDAVVFVWKRLGTTSENQPEVHDIIRAYNALVKIAAPTMIFKSEAIVHPDDVASFIDWEEAPLSYNPTLMALIWEALATREVRLLRHSMTKRYEIPERAAWINYVRVHDDIGWSFANEDASEIGITGFDHRLFLNKFYTGVFPGSFAVGLPFNYNPLTQDMRICGMGASLAGLEQALALDDPELIDHAIARIIMIHSVIIAAGGIPLIYLGDEIAMLNDYSFRDDPLYADDNRVVHRPAYDWERWAGRSDSATPQGQVYTSLVHMIRVRKITDAFNSQGRTQFFDTQNPHVLGFIRSYDVMVLTNFSERAQIVHPGVLAAYWQSQRGARDLLTGKVTPLEQPIQLEPYQFVWLARLQV